MPRESHERKNREVPLADAGQDYARVTTMLGNGRVRAKLSDGTERLCRIRGSMRRREWVRVGDVVLVCFRDELAGDAADVVFRYQPAEVAMLHKMGVHIAADEDDDIADDLIAFEDPDVGDI